MERQETINHIRKERRNLVLALVVSILAVNGTVMAFTGSEMETMVSDISRILTIGSATILSIVVVSKQKVEGLFGKAYASLAAGLILWLLAESIWAYYEIGLQVESPFPSLADVFWIAGYLPFGHHLFTMSKFYGKGIKKSSVVIVVIAAAIFGSLYIQGIIGISELEGDSAVVGLVISIAYPLLDAILIIPAVLIVLNSGRGILTSIPWIFVGWIFTFIADTLLGLTAVTNFTGEVFHITMLYNAAYLCFMMGLLWYNRLFIFNEKKTNSLA